MSTFSGTGFTTCTFNVLYQQGRSRAREAVASVRNVPWAVARNIIHTGGRGVKIYTYDLFVATELEMTYLEQATGYLGTLTIQEGTFTAVLKSIDSTLWDWNNNQVVKAVWWLDSD